MMPRPVSPAGGLPFACAVLLAASALIGCDAEDRPRVVDAPDGTVPPRSTSHPH